MIDSVVRPLEPKDRAGWSTRGDVRKTLRSSFPTVSWYHRANNLAVLSAVEVVNDPKEKIAKGPEYHISVSKPLPDGTAVSRCSLAEAMWVLAQFGLEGWEEDNHTPNGKVRNFWRPVAEPLVGLDCECKDQETVVVEGDYEYRPLKPE